MKVVPKNDEIRKLLKHPNGTGFQETGPAEWPDDSFTYRRIQDGDVTAEAAPEVKGKAAKTEVVGKAEPETQKQQPNVDRPEPKGE